MPKRVFLLSICVADTYVCILFYQEIVLDTEMIKKLNYNPKLERIVVISIKAACTSLLTLPQLSEIEKFYWHFIALCCSHVQPNPENLDELINYERVIIQLSKIFQKYYNLKINTTKDTHQIPYELNDISSTDVKDYFQWIQKMQKILTHWQEKFTAGKFNYDDIFIYANNLDMITVFAEAMHIKKLVLDEIDEIKKRYSSLYANLCLLLVKNSSDSGW